MGVRTSDLELSLDSLWALVGGPPLEREHRFAPPRRWRFDRAHVASRVAIEVDGGTWTGGRHVRGSGYDRDAAKGNAAAAAGWAVFHVTRTMLEADPVSVLTPIVQTIQDRLSRSEAA